MLDYKLFCTYNISKVLAELKFDEFCIASINFNQSPYIPSKGGYYKNSEYIGKGTYACPLISQALNFLRIDFNLDVESRPTRFAGDEQSSYYQPYINGCVISMAKYSTYEEAILEAISHAIKLIKK